MAMGASAGFSAVTIPQLQIKENSTTQSQFYLTDDQISWFGKAIIIPYEYTNFDPLINHTI